MELQPVLLHEFGRSSVRLGDAPPEPRNLHAHIATTDVAVEGPAEDAERGADSSHLPNQEMAGNRVATVRQREAAESEGLPEDPTESLDGSVVEGAEDGPTTSIDREIVESDKGPSDRKHRERFGMIDRVDGLHEDPERAPALHLIEDALHFVRTADHRKQDLVGSPPDHGLNLLLRPVSEGVDPAYHRRL